MRRLLPFALLLVLVTTTYCVRERTAEGPSSPGSGAEATGELGGTCTVERIVDGDTLVCVEGSERIRLLLVDAPEMSQGEFGRMATDALSEMLPVGTAAPVERDVRERDQYGRVLAYLYTPEGQMVNEEMARLGFVVLAVYPPNVHHIDRIRAASEEAREAGAGLWSVGAFECAPRDHRAGRC